MSGIFGVFDPTRPDSTDVLTAAEAAGYRGVPQVTIDGALAVGTFARPGEARQIRASAHDLMVADARIDGTVNGTPASAIASTHQGLGLMAKLLEHHGVSALNGIAADFAVATFHKPAARLLLCRDAFGLRPLFWASRGSRVAFASDPAVLWRLGVASSGLDPIAVARHLAGMESYEGRTAFVDIRAVQPGSWVAFSPDGSNSSGRWFEPALLIGPRLRGQDAVDAVREAVGAAVRSRTQGRRTGLTLSGGRDSGSLAVALAQAGVTTTCVTQVFDQDLPVGEQESARTLADQLEFPWVAAYVPSRPSIAEIDDIPRWTGTPLGFGGFPQATAPVNVAAAAGVEVLLTGEGGEPLFSSAPVGVWDLVRRGDLRMASEAARAFHRRWIYPYPTIAKAGVRAILPPGLLNYRERARLVPPWVEGIVNHSYDERTAPRNAFEHLLTALRRSDANDYEIEERLHQTRAIERAHPLLDLRVVKVACSLALEERVPVPGPKPLLTRAFLNDVAGARVKMRFGPYYRRLARYVQKLDPAVFREESIAARSDLVLSSGLPAVREPRWLTESLMLLPVEMWLRSG